MKRVTLLAFSCPFSFLVNRSNMSYCSIPTSFFRSLPVFRRYTFSDVPTNLKGYKVQNVREKMGVRNL